MKSSRPERGGRGKLDLPRTRETPAGEGLTCGVRTVSTVSGGVQGAGRTDYYFSEEPKARADLSLGDAKKNSQGSAWVGRNF